MLRQKTSGAPTEQNRKSFLCLSKVVLLSAAVSLFVFGCSVYRSPDRDSFDSNALAGAPKKTSLLALDREASEIGAASCSLFADPMNETPTVTRQENGTKQLVVAHNITYESARSIVCNFDLSDHTSDQDFSGLIARAKAQVEQLADRLQL